MSRDTVLNIHDVTSHGRNTHKWNTSAAHDIVRYRYQRMNVTILYLKGLLIKSIYIHERA